MKPKKTLNSCGGCYNNDYNHGLGGAKQCWSFKSAKIIKRIQIASYQAPPHDKDHAEYRMDCYQKKGYVFVRPDVLTSEGYWKS